MRSLGLAAVMTAVAMVATVVYSAPCGAPPTGNPVTTFTFGPHVLLHYETANPAFTPFTQPTFTVSGNTVTVTQQKLTPIPPPPSCFSADLDLGPLAPGHYVLVWKYDNFDLFNGVPFALIVTSGFDVPQQIPALDSRALAALLIVLAIAGVWILSARK